MSDEELNELFDYGTSILDQAKLNPHSLNYGDLLAEAKRHIDQAVSSADRDDPKFSNDINTCASVHAFCLALVDYSSELDSYFASSPAIKRMNGWAHESPARLEKEPYDDDRELDDFWAGIEQIQDDQYTLLDKPELLSYEVWATSTKVFCEAISYSNPSGSLYHVWYLCLSVVFYLKIEVVNPSEVALCISSLTKAGALNDSKGNSLPDDLDPYLSDCIKHILHNPQIEFRLNSLKDLAAFYTQRQLSIFKKRWDAYQTGSGEFSADLDDAISASFEGLLWSKDTGISREIRFELIFGYARASYERFNATDQQRWDDLEDPIDFLQEIKRYSETENFEVANARQLFAIMLAELAYMLSERPETGDWEKSLAYWEESVLMTQSKDPHLAERLFELGNLALKIYRTSEDGKFEYYLKACDAYERATDAAADTALVAEIQFSLASVLYHNFLDTHVQEDFDKSIKAGASACNLVFRTPELAQRRPHWNGIYGHCVVLLRSVQEDFNEDDEALTKRLERIIDLAELILPHSHPLQLMAMNRFGLAHALLARIKHRAAQPTLTCLDSLEKALELHKTALEKTCPNDPFLHVRLAFVGIIHYQISELPGVNSSHLDLSVDFLWRARSACRKSLDYSMRLAKALEDRYKLLGKPSDLKECISILTEEGLVGHMKTSLDAAVQLARVCCEHDLHDVVIPAYRRVFTALRRMTQLGLSSSERQDALVYSVGHACDAAAFALKSGQDYTAVELLEEGRNLFFSQLFPTQMDTSAIKLQDSDLALSLEHNLERIRHYRRATDAANYQAARAFHGGGSAEDIEENASDDTPETRELLHYGAALERCLKRIRNLPGQDNFMSTKPFSYLKQAAKLCPVVYINISQFRCDALLIDSRKGKPEVLVVPLHTKLEKVLALSQIMRGVIVQQGREVRQGPAEEDTRAMFQKRTKGKPPTEEVRSVLRQLWNKIVQPVLSALDYLGPNDGSSDGLPQICWCPSGPLATFLPLHAAGDYARGPEHCAMTHVVSTYIPTLSSLLHGLERESHTDMKDARMLLISQSASPPDLPLPGVVVEKDEIIATFGRVRRSGKVTSLHDQAGCAEEAIKQLPSHEILHLACHGIQNMIDPLESSVILYGANLTVREIIQTPLPKAELVYLSACQTATGSTRTPDESFSLAGSFMFAGYKGAIATMWSINDRDGCDVATSFYELVLQKDGSPVENAALALHDSVQRLREANPEIDPIRWIPFVYFGTPGLSNAHARDSNL